MRRIWRWKAITNLSKLTRCKQRPPNKALMHLTNDQLDIWLGDLCTSPREYLSREGNDQHMILTPQIIATPPGPELIIHVAINLFKTLLAWHLSEPSQYLLRLILFKSFILMTLRLLSAQLHTLSILFKNSIFPSLAIEDSYTDPLQISRPSGLRSCIEIGRASCRERVSPRV